MILSREEFFSRLNERVTESDEDSLRFIEDMTDTYNNLESNVNGYTEEQLNERIIEVENKWAKRYRDRFFNEDEETEETELKSYDDLFTED